MRKGSIEGSIRSRRGERAWIYGLGILTGALGGLVAVAYRALASWLEGRRGGFLERAEGGFALRAALWLALVAAAGALTAFLVRKLPHIKGSGIPQVRAALMRRITPDWRLELPAKFSGGVLALGAGLSLGREGPSIQMGALAGSGIARVAAKPELERYLVTAGAAAGISAAFNAPLAGVLFCLEELHRNVSPVMLTCAMASAFAANAVSWILLGNAPVFALGLGPSLPLRLYPSILLVGLCAGLLGKLFNSGLLRGQVLAARAVRSEALRVAAAFVAAGSVALVLPALTGGGHLLVDEAAAGGLSIRVLALLLAGKFLFTIFCYSSGSPGGIFLPMLVMGALLGGIFGQGLEAAGLAEGFGPNYVVLGMVAFFTAVVRAPITAAILISEMSGSFAHFPALILVSVAASLTAGLLGSEPIYDSLLERLVPEPRAPKEEGTVVLHVPVLEGSALASCVEARDCMPDGAVFLGVLRGEEERLPRADMAIHPGDVLEVLAAEGDASEIKERLLGLARPAKGSVEA